VCVVCVVCVFGVGGGVVCVCVCGLGGGVLCVCVGEYVCVWRLLTTLKCSYTL